MYMLICAPNAACSWTPATRVCVCVYVCVCVCVCVSERERDLTQLAHGPPQRPAARLLVKERHDPRRLTVSQ
jgi:hypothetical protein